jgi:hypothetical protein
MNKYREWSSKIQTKIRRYETATEELKTVIANEQLKCNHEFCYQTPFRSSEFVVSFNPIRVCAHCGYEEEGSIWSGDGIWSRHDYSPSVLENSAIIQNLSRDEFYKHRLPVHVRDPYRIESDERETDQA